MNSLILSKNFMSKIALYLNLSGTIYCNFLRFQLAYVFIKIGDRKDFHNIGNHYCNYNFASNSKTE